MTLFALWELAIRSIVFAMGATSVAQACDISPTWKSVAFALFCCFWSDCVFGGWNRSAKRDSKSESSTSAPRKPATDVMTPAQVAEAAHQTMRKLKAEPEN